MKKSDIKIGVEYAEQRSAYGSATHVRVVNLDGKYTTGWGYNRRTLTGATVVNVKADGAEGPERVVPNRQIREEWAPYIARVNAEAKRRRDNAKAASDARSERAKSLLELIPLLRHAGIEDDREYLYNNELIAILRREVPDCIETTEHSTHFVAPLADSLTDYVRSGSALKIKVSDLKILLGAR